MKKVSLHGQLTFDEMKGSLERLPKTNRWVQMGDSLPWTEYENDTIEGKKIKLNGDYTEITNFVF